MTRINQYWASIWHSLNLEEISRRRLIIDGVLVTRQRMIDWHLDRGFAAPSTAMLDNGITIS